MASYIGAYDAICQECQSRFNLNKKFSSVINLDIQGFDNDKFENGTLNRVVCPFCSTEFTYEIPMIVFSMNLKFACVVKPNLTKENLSAEKEPPYAIMPRGFKYRIVRYLIEAKEKYDIEKAGLDDYVVEYIKLCEFSDSDAFPFDEKNIIFKSFKDDVYKFEQVDYNNKVMKTFDVVFPHDKIPKEIINKNSCCNKWLKIDRQTLKEEI